MSAKAHSHAAQVVAALWVGTLSVLKGLGIIALDMTDIVFSGAAIAAVFSPVFVSIWLDKIKEIRWGNHGN